MTTPRTFLVEAYAPAQSEFDGLLEQARRAGESHAAGAPVRHVRSILVAEDETCFHLYEAGSLEAIAQAVSAADIHAQRIVEVRT